MVYYLGQGVVKTAMNKRTLAGKNYVKGVYGLSARESNGIISLRLEGIFKPAFNFVHITY